MKKYTIKEHKEGWKKNYRDWYESTLSSYKNALMLGIDKKIISILDTIEFESLLEVGCCWGYHLPKRLCL